MSQNRTKPFFTRYGANYNEETGLIDFKLFSKNGTAAILCIFDAPKDKEAVFNIKMVKNGNVFETSFNPYEIGGIDKVFYYGYRVFGANFEYTENWIPNSDIGFKTKVDSNNNRFNPNKLAYDPYSRELSHLHSDVSEDLDIFRSGSPSYFKDNSRLAPKSVFRFLNVDKSNNIKPGIRALKDEIIGEVHLKSLTELQNIKEKGTYKAAAIFAQKIKEMGVTMVEFLPLQEFDPNEGIGNYWGYMPLCYFSPVKRYAYDKEDGQVICEFKQMIDEFHRNDIKVCMDVVYNHTGEAKNYDGRSDDVNLFSYALIDNSDYYKSDDFGHYAINSGCHNDANTAGDGFKHIVADSLEYFINIGVDAFRFDLAAALMDTETGIEVKYDRNHSLIGEMKQILENRGIKVNNPDEASDGINLIAEPWTCGGHNAYQLGNFPECFAEWNDASRNIIRAFSVRPGSVDFLAIAHLLKGSPQKFKSPFKSVNYISCHDGFTLWDLNSYDKKSEDTCGGSDWELCSSFNGNKAERNRAIKNEVALLTLSSGCFMTQIDDIVLHSKNGNNNSYNIDGPVNYINFDNLTEEKKILSDFIKKLINLRKTEKIFKTDDYVKNMKFFGLFGENISENDSFWTKTDCNFLAFSSYTDNQAVFGAFNKGSNEITFDLPEISNILPNSSDKKYYLVFNTQNENFSKDGILYTEKSFKMAPHTILLTLVK